MNGRLYDPELGRMLSPDPYVQVPEYSQNFNRYSYVLNNPLNLTDPTGFSFFGKIGSWLKTNWRTVLVIVVAFVLVVTGWGAGIAAGIYGALGGGVVYAGTITAYVITGAFIGAVTGGLGAALNGGSFGDVLRGAVVGGISGAITGALHVTSGVVNIVGHGIVGGASNVAMGGKFGDGFLSASVAAAAAESGLISPKEGTFGGDQLNMASRTAIASVVGGTASTLGGGKFSNGAVTGAMSHLLNSESDDQLQRYAAKHRWSPEYKNQIMNYFLSIGLDETNRTIDALKKALYVDDTSICRSLANKEITQEVYEQYQGNNRQSLDAAISASAMMDPNYKFSPSISVTVTAGFSKAGIAYQKGVAFGTHSSRSFSGVGIATPGLILSLSVGPGEPPLPGTKTTSFSGGYWGGAGYEAGSVSGQATWPGAGVMRNTWK